MTTGFVPQEERHLVRLEIGVSAQFKVDTHQEVTFENLRDYFTSKKFSGNKRVGHIIAFLDDAKEMGCELTRYSNPLSPNSVVYVEFEVKVPKEKLDEFESKYARYAYFY